MPSGLNLYRRSAVYYFRRRLPTGTGTGPVTLHVSLHTKDRAKAKALAAELTHVSDTLFDEARRGHLTTDELQRILVAVARRQAKKLELLAVVDRANPVADPMSGERADRINGAVYRLLAERDRAAALPQDPAFLRGCGLDPSEAEQVQMSLEFYRSQKLAIAMTLIQKAKLNGLEPMAW